MARATGERSGLEQWLYRIGYVSARVGETLERVREGVAGVADPDTGTAPRRAGEAHQRQAGEAESVDDQLGPLAATTAAGMLVAQLLRPRPVNWPRAILAGTLGTLLYDAETIVESRPALRKFGTSAAVRGNGGAESIAALLARYSAGIGMAAFYGRYLYGRLPGPPWMQGLAYGLLESGTRGSGGAVALLNRLSPEVRVPTGYSVGLMRETETRLQALRRHLAFGLGVGLVYRR